MAINTQKVRDPISEQVKVQSRGRADDADAEGCELKAFEKNHYFEAAEAWLRLEEARSNLMLRRQVVHWLMAMSTLTCGAALAAVFLNGRGLTAIPREVIIVLLTMTVAQVAAMFPTVVRYFFPTR